VCHDPSNLLGELMLADSSVEAFDGALLCCVRGGRLRDVCLQLVGSSREALRAGFEVRPAEALASAAHALPSSFSTALAYHAQAAPGTARGCVGSAA
jgi:hypothetical protein